MVDIEKLREVLTFLSAVMPLSAKDGPDYAEIIGADGSKIALTMRPELFAAVNELPALLDELERKTKALEEFCQSAECAAGCDEGCSEDDAYSEILSFAGSALAVSYAAARAALKGTPNDH
ncbi:hypothetical protein [Sphingobium sp. WCS2017Hpa-17]|uniref:hypothetical protein n=1 Tax=Sphingobium sp. WCS2017Hpa-17 TaxID=3073638 RepID=UPI00288C5184|nr:hypothetical protein [Sphingobium sp. WCS2017Hpa-17]